MAETSRGVAVLSPFLSMAIETLTDRGHKKFLKHRKFNQGLIQELKTKMIALGLIFDAAEEKQFANDGVRKWLLELKDATYEAKDVLDGIQIEYQARQSKAVTEGQERSSSSQDPLNQEIEPKLQEILDKFEDLRQESNAFGLRKAVGRIEFDVFLNFRGEDVRHGFLSYLRDALQEEKIKTFYDEEHVKKGENVAAILEKIEVSKMSVVIFSKDYASSSFCLEELVRILECNKRWGHKAFPVFYNVDPKVVARQSGSYEEAFRKHENEKGTDSEEVRTWRASLAEAAAISGQHLQNKRAEKIDIREIVEAVKKILAEFDSEKRSSKKREDTSLIDEFEGFYGRDADKKAIIDMLISDDDNGSKPGVIPIVGMGGVGKTTLAQHVYNDKAVEEQFKIRAWVCVSDQFDVTKVTKEIVEKVTRKACQYNDLEQLQGELKKALNEEEFLLVLDDVWSEDYERWLQVLTPLRSGARGSKIIITTRSTVVASRVRTVPTHDLRELGDEDCWKLFARHACLDVNSAANPPELQEIGKKIVRKCRGLPLAAKALGGVLRCETKAEKWKEVLESEIWDVQNANILPSLAMSYIHLPSHLRRCFAYCATFPQDYVFAKEELVALWMSEGFLVQQKGNRSLKETGDMYFDDLVSRSFFQQNGGYFVMHDLVHDLARFVSGEFCSRLEGGTSWKIGERTRHLSYDITEEHFAEKFQRIHETPFLRSFVLTSNLWCFCESRKNTCFNKEVIDGLLPTQKLLRVLFLYCRGIRKLPNSIGNLKHMRHLDLSRTSIRLLPEPVTTLVNLEILILRGCRELVELPGDMARLINLCQLDLGGTRKLKRMPPEMGKLKKLSNLSDFVVGEKGASGIKELGHLHNLRGEISIKRLQNLKDDWDASETILKDKKNLKKLVLDWEDYAGEHEVLPYVLKGKKNLKKLELECKGYADDSKQVLERLQPHMQIEIIEIMYYGGTEFPNWVGDISFSKLKQLVLHKCENCICMPPLGQLACLEELTIRDDAALEAIGVEFYGMCKPGEKPFSSLKRLKFVAMNHWREWSSCIGAFPVLEELEINDCPKLMSVPSHLPSLKRLKISGSGEVEFENLLISACAALETINIWRSKKVKCIPVETFPNLKKLEIWDCSNLESFGSAARRRKRKRRRRRRTSPHNLKTLPQVRVLEELKLEECPKLVSVPNQLPSLRRLWIEKCGELDIENLLISTCATLETIRIRGTEKVKCISLETFPNLKELEMRYCHNLESLVGSTAAAASTTTTRTSNPLFSPSLTKLSIRDCSKLVTFPRGGLHAPNLKTMNIEECVNLKWLPQGMHSLLPSLENLSIYNSPEIESFLDGGLPSNLKSLQIQWCDKLVGEVMQWGLQSLPSLSRIIIETKGPSLHKDVESSFPEETLLPSSVEYLEISGFHQMKSFNYKGLQHLSSLQSLTIEYCKNLESLPEEGLPSSLSYLSIQECPLLKKRCEPEIGEDWPKIKHIPRLIIY